VFDGSKGDYSDGDQCNPINCYGIMRHEIKKYQIHPCQINSLNLLDKIPKNTSLNINKAKRLTRDFNRSITFS